MQSQQLSLFDLVETGRIEELKRFLNQPEKLRATNGNGENLLHVAARFNQAKCVQLLLDAKVDPHATDNDGLNAAHVAAAQGNLEALRALLTADMSLCKTKGRENRNLLFTAASSGNNDLIKALILDYKFDVNHIDLTSKQTLAIYAAINNKPNLIALLVDPKINANLEIENNRGETALEIALIKRNFDVALTLINGRANVKRDGLYDLVKDEKAVKAQQLKKIIADGNPELSGASRNQRTP